ncbi:CotH kinase family protein [Winogradskyella litoriviva]|uniref:CotH kinase family protein n=1 Tax=Winogradskyella litoriviva TaxID=1220182 RepID=A0ABX2E6D9_9FLAO|nr:CotH kinase family protein [Winogradskyella litoriviva]NRD23988.1 CotH kinase family protein [Winogradskyella litoriviva]
MKKNITLLLIFMLSMHAFSQDLYDINTIQTIEIQFAESNWDALLDAEKAGENNYTEATSVTINGTVYNQVGVKYKGNSSYNANQIKNPFHIELDTYVDQDHQGYTDIKLANVMFDPSFVRETVAYNIVNQYMDAPEANYANVYVNGTLIGLYTNTESISKKFVNKHFDSNDNAFFSCSPPDGAGPQTTTLPNLEYLGTSYTSYDDAYEIKSNDEDDPSVALAHWDDLIDLTYTLNYDISNIEAVLDVDMALWMLAFDNVIVNLDSYIGQFKQNYYLYKDNNGQFKSVVWDLNMSFGTFAMTGESSGGPGPGGGGSTLNSTTQKAQLDYLLHDTSTSFPLVSKLLAVPKYKRMYLAHFKTILTENISNSNYLTLANDYQAIISAAVAADTNKFYTNSQFTGNINTDYSLGMNTAPGLTNLMSARSSYLLSQSDFTNTQPTITNLGSLVEVPIIGDVITITANVTDTNDVYLGYRTDETVPFTKVLMYDDGAHNDGAAGDNVYGVDVTINESYMQYYIYAENSNIGAFSPARAEHEFYTVNATYTTLTAGDLVVNEILASNDTGETDEQGEYEDWIELYNTSDEAVSLDNLYLSDDAEDPLIYQFPTGTTLEPDSYLIVWCDKDTEQGDFHADFKLSSGGETVILSYADGTILENITFGEQTTDLAYARNPNGTGDFVIQEPTFNANNEGLEEYEVLNVGDLVINEILASNDSGATDEQGEYEDWIELYNTTNETLSLDNLYLSDDADDPLVYQFPTGTTLEADSYLIVWCDKDTDQGDFHADFKFSSSGETAILSYANGTILENITFGEQTTDMAYARNPNGTGDFVIQTPTFAMNNQSLSIDEVLFNDGLRFYPNPTSNYLEIENSNYSIETVKVYNLQGQQLLNNQYLDKNSITLDFTAFSKGLYMVVVNEITVLKIARN